MKRDNIKGFTLIELLMTIAIIGLLAAIAIPTYLGQQKRAANQEAYANLQSLRVLAEQYYAENGRYLVGPDGTEYGYRCTTVACTATVTSIQTTAGLNGFQPGLPLSQKFDYRMIACPTDNPPVPNTSYGTCSATGVPTCTGAGTLAGQSFLACALGRTGTMVAGQVFWINNFNMRDF